MKRRIISGDVVLSDGFLSLSFGAQLLYYTLNLSADDSGFVTTVQSMMRMLGVGESELAELDGTYIIYFEEERAALIVHWLKHNTLKKLMASKSSRPELESRVYIDEGGLYTLDPGDGRQTMAEHKAALLGDTYIKHKKTERNETERNKTEQKRTESRSSPLPGTQTARTDAGAQADRLFKEYEEAEPKVVMRDDIVKEAGRRLHIMNPDLKEPRNVFLSEKQVECLERLASPEAVERYIKRLGRMIEETGCDPKSHYQTIRKWIAEDIRP